MKRTITLIALTVFSLSTQAQSFTENFEGFSLSPNSAYSSTTSAPFVGTNASFEYTWDTQFSFWSGGFSYTNKYDSSTAGFSNLYGVKAYKGYNQSNTYVIGQNKAVIKLVGPYKGIEGMYLTNSTYAYKSMKNGDAFAKKFGGTTGNDPDFFKITIKGYKNGTMKTDSVEFYLADFRSSNNAQDYILDTWQWVNTMSLGEVDSVRFFMYSSDVGSFGINTPLFFGLDNFTASPSFVGINEYVSQMELTLYPNPATNLINISGQFNNSTLEIIDTQGSVVHHEMISGSQHQIDISGLPKGLYFLKVQNQQSNMMKKLIKN